MKLINETIDYSIKHTSNIHQTYIKHTLKLHRIYNLNTNSIK